ncbi:MAG: hypothetical protein J7L61_04530, partial [Thermoplasmata archaeon]|nr:hypothetical protein [Thermoplasmata archaeon]
EAAVESDEIPCPNCGTMISKDATMCYACGYEIPQDSSGGDEGGEGEGDEGGESSGEGGGPVIAVKKKVVKKKIL